MPPIPPALRSLPLPALILLTVFAIALLPALFRRPAPKIIPPRTPLAATPRLSLTPVRYPLRPQSLDDLLALPPADLGRVDIACVNLLCAARLPGSEDLDIDHALTTLDRWADHVAAETDRHLYRVTDPQYAGAYRGSEPLFRASFLLQVL